MMRTIARNTSGGGDASGRGRGFALLLTLMLVLVAAVTMAGVARRSATEALQARTAAEELQRRWAVRSIREWMGPQVATVLQAGAVLAHEREAERWEPAMVRGLDLGSRDEAESANAPAPLEAMWIELTLAGREYRLRLTDEQAKVNLAELLAATDQATVVTAVEELVDRRSIRAAVVGPTRIRPVVRGDFAEEAVEALPALTSWHQVFEAVEPAALVGTADEAGAADRLTLWGDGRVNLSTAPAEVVRTVGRAVLGVEATDEMLEARETVPDFHLATWLQGGAGWRERERAEAHRWFTDVSMTHGLWIVAEGRQRQWHHFSVMRTNLVERSEPAAEPHQATGRGGSPPPTAAERVTQDRPENKRRRVLLRRVDYDW